MRTSRFLPRERWTPYFDSLSKRILRDDVPTAATVDVRGGAIGERRAVHGAPLLGITYDPRDHLLDVALDGVDHLIQRPVGIWITEGPDGAVDELTVLREDGLRETITLECAAVGAHAGAAAGAGAC